jgi:hypothetical protein
MASETLKSEAEIKSEKILRYLELICNYWGAQRKLRNEFPDKFFESNRLFAQKMLNAGLIK